MKKLIGTLVAATALAFGTAAPAVAVPAKPQPYYTQGEIAYLKALSKIGLGDASADAALDLGYAICESRGTRGAEIQAVNDAADGRLAAMQSIGIVDAAHDHLCPELAPDE